MLAAVLVLGILEGLISGRAALAAPLDLVDCDVPDVTGKARCGSLSVFENRTAATGRKISLKIVVLPATKPGPVGDPLFVLAGGPGEAATEEAAGTAGELASLREHRDFVFVDQRGTGGSHALNCDLFGDGTDLQALLGDFLPLERVRRCRAELEKDADLRLYTTTIAMDDLDDVRAALGYKQIVLLGGSYGTRASLVYMRQHPSSVAAAVLESVSPTTDHVPLRFPQYAQRALDGVIGECLEDAACHAAFPNLAQEASAVFTRLSAGPASATVLNPKTGNAVSVKLSRDIVGEAIRYLTYEAGTASLVPVVLHEAASGNFDPIAEFAIFARQLIVGSGSMGMYLSVTCAEDIPLIDPRAAERLANKTYLGDYRWKQQSAACEAWPRGSAPKDFSDPVRSQAPALLIVGEWDPVTPSQLADQAVRSLPQGRVAVVPHGAHSQDGLEGGDCLDRLVVNFVGTGNSKALDFSCLRKMHRGPFALESPVRKPISMADAELARFAGSYVGEGTPLQAQVVKDSGKLRLDLGNDLKFLLVPVSPNAFRIVGAIGALAAFEVTDGHVTRLRIRRPGEAEIVFGPKP